MRHSSCRRCRSSKTKRPAQDGLEARRPKGHHKQKGPRRTGWQPVARRAIINKLGVAAAIEAIAGQIGLHLAYGGETFLYALDWMPLFVVAAALASLTPWRPVVLVMAAVFAVTGALHNGAQLRAALTTVTTEPQQ